MNIFFVCVNIGSAIHQFWLAYRSWCLADLSEELILHELHTMRAMFEMITFSISFIDINSPAFMKIMQGYK